MTLEGLDWSQRALALPVDATAYHADPCPVPSLSPSIAKILEASSPEHAYLAHPRLGGRKGESTKAMDKGALFHKLLLGRGAELAIVDHKDWRTNDAKAQRDAARERGQIPVLAAQLAEAEEAAEAVRKRLVSASIRRDGESELAIAWREPVFNSDAEVLCRCMVDHLTVARGRMTIYELKTTENAHPDAFARTVAGLGYDLAAVAYVHAVEALHPEWAGRVDFVFLACELEPPYAVSPLRLDGEFRALGDHKWRRAVRTWHACLTSNTWPSYVDGIGVVSPPHWALAKAALEGLSL